ncbi:hypothetical protein HRR84_004903 [Exophiala dermatitidis]|nr:hypothetical protein HRR84_004903 [Exophiala dermatitidis]
MAPPRRTWQHLQFSRQTRPGSRSKAVLLLKQLDSTENSAAAPPRWDKVASLTVSGMSWHRLPGPLDGTFLLKRKNANTLGIPPLQFNNDGPPHYRRSSASANGFPTEADLSCPKAV